MPVDRMLLVCHYNYADEDVPKAGNPLSSKLDVELAFGAPKMLSSLTQPRILQQSSNHHGSQDINGQII